VENTVSMTMITHATREEQLETVLGLYNKWQVSCEQLSTPSHERKMVWVPWDPEPKITVLVGLSAIYPNWTEASHSCEKEKYGPGTRGARNQLWLLVKASSHLPKTES
jgi:hypothetical protein